MRQTRRMTTGLLLAAMLAACSQSRPAAEPEVAQPAEDSSASLPAAELLEPAPPVPATDAPSGSMVVYACDDGSGVTVTYDENTALVKLPTGSTMLSRAEAASEGGTDAYLGEELSLYRIGKVVELHAAGKTRMCNKS